MVQLVGILNVTPDSFSDGGKFFEPHNAIRQAHALFASGATFIDVGAESTKPRAIPLSDNEEWRRLEPVLRELQVQYPGKISVDTYHSRTAERAFSIGPMIINDVTGMNSLKMVEVVTRLKAAVIVSHLPGRDIQKAHQLAPVSTVEQVKQELLEKAYGLQERGISQEQIILDPGIGFGKTMELNWQLLRFAEQVPEFSVMIGYSRKRFLGDNRMDLGPNLEAGKIAAASGARYLRVHDIAGHAQLLKN